FYPDFSDLQVYAFTSLFNACGNTFVLTCWTWRPNFLIIFIEHATHRIISSVHWVFSLPLAYKIIFRKTYQPVDFNSIYFNNGKVESLKSACLSVQIIRD